jgi:hypothetical protein
MSSWACRGIFIHHPNTPQDHSITEVVLDKGQGPWKFFLLPRSDHLVIDDLEKSAFHTLLLPSATPLILFFLPDLPCGIGYQFPRTSSNPIQFIFLKNLSRTAECEY